MRGCRLFGCPARAAGESRYDGDEDADVRLAPTGILGRPRPPDHLYRHLERAFDLVFVRDVVRGAYAERGGRGGPADDETGCRLTGVNGTLPLPASRPTLPTTAP